MGERKLNLEELSAKVGGDAKGALGVLLAYIGDQTGIYRALEKLGPVGCESLAKNLDLNERYLLEFLSANVANGYVTCDFEKNLFSLTEEQAAVFAHEGELTCMQGFFQSIVSQYATHEDAVDVFRTGRGRPWNEHHPCCFSGTDRFFRPGYEAHLLDVWIPSLKGIQEKLNEGVKVADIGCGHGSSTIMMAKRFPTSRFFGFDFHAPSIESARKKLVEEKIKNVEFLVSSAKEIPDKEYEFACIFDALHDMGDPVGASKRIRDVLSDTGTFMVVEPTAADTLEDNVSNNPMSAALYSFSTLVCVPTSRSQEVGLALGAQAGEKRLSKVLKEAGFSEVRKTSENAANMVLEARA